MTTDTAIDRHAFEPAPNPEEVGPGSSPPDNDGNGKGAPFPPHVYEHDRALTPEERLAVERAEVCLGSDNEPGHSVNGQTPDRVTDRAVAENGDVDPDDEFSMAETLRSVALLRCVARRNGFGQGRTARTNTKLTEEEVRAIRHLARSEGLGPKKIQDRLDLDVSRQAIGLVIRGETWQGVK